MDRYRYHKPGNSVHIESSKILWHICLIIISISAHGCATQASLTVRSQPEGAFITENGTGKSFGIAPVKVYYDQSALLRHTDSDGCYLVKGFEARWVSGSSASLELIRLCGSTIGKYEVQFNRDTSQPGFEKDMNFALQIQALRAQQQQAKAAKKSADAAFFSALQSLQPKSVYCTSTQIGNIVHTNCR